MTPPPTPSLISLCDGGCRCAVSLLSRIFQGLLPVVCWHILYIRASDCKLYSKSCKKTSPMLNKWQMITPGAHLCLVYMGLLFWKFTQFSLLSFCENYTWPYFEYELKICFWKVLVRIWWICKCLVGTIGFDGFLRWNRIPIQLYQPSSHPLSGMLHLIVTPRGTSTPITLSLKIIDQLWRLIHGELF